MNKKNLILRIVLILIVIIIQILPIGAVLRFRSFDEFGNIIITTKYYSYFSPVPFGYANFGPLLTAITTVIILILFIMEYLSKKLVGPILLNILLFSVFTGVSPIFYGLNYISYAGIIIILLLAIITVLYYVDINKKRSSI